MECCPTCGTTRIERVFVLVKEGTRGESLFDGLTYHEAAYFFGRSVRRIQNLVYEHRLEVRYGRRGRHPRRIVFLPPSTIREIRRYLPRPRPALTQSVR